MHFHMTTTDADKGDDYFWMWTEVERRSVR
jgi:hypothetical protein